MNTASAQPDRTLASRIGGWLVQAALAAAGVGIGVILGSIVGLMTGLIEMAC